MISTASIIARAQALAPRLLAWAKRRAVERSTWLGLAALAAGAGKSALADHFTSMADILPMLLGTGGAALMAASTSARAAGSDQA